MVEGTRGTLGGTYRITRDFLAGRGMLDEVAAQLAPASRALLDKLPFPFAWQEMAPLEEIQRLLYAKSPELCVELGFAAAKYFTEGIVAPVARMAATLFGQTPESIFGNLDRFFALVVRGFEFRYERGGDKLGTVFVHISGGPMHPSLFQQVRGNLRMTYPLCSVDGSVGEATLLRSGEADAEVSFAVRWT